MDRPQTQSASPRPRGAVHRWRLKLSGQRFASPPTAVGKRPMGSGGSTCWQLTPQPTSQAVGQPAAKAAEPTVVGTRLVTAAHGLLQRGMELRAGTMSCGENFVTTPVLLQRHQTWGNSPPLRMHREQEVPGIAHGKMRREKFRRQSEKQKFPHKIVNSPAPVQVTRFSGGTIKGAVFETGPVRSHRTATPSRSTDDPGF